jgi:uncharacterized protein
LRVLIDIGHPAHVHFFKNPIRVLRQHGHEVLITSRDKEMALGLLDQLGLQHHHLSSHAKGGLLSLGVELIKRNVALAKVVRKFKPDIMAAIGGTSIAHVGRFTGIPSLAFYDTENATLQNAITYPFASCVVVPRCYGAWLPRRRHIRYSGYHELSYLHPAHFSPDRNLAIRNGLAPEGDSFFVRLVSWQASHDAGETGWSLDFLTSLVQTLSKNGKVLISSEGLLDGALKKYQYTGSLLDVHHVMAFCRAFIGESATMASECAVLGVPAIYAAETGRGYTTEQEARYGLVRNLRELDWMQLQSMIADLLSRPREYWQARRQDLLTDTIDVAAYVADCIETFPAPLVAYNQRNTKDR